MWLCLKEKVFCVNLVQSILRKEAKMRLKILTLIILGLMLGCSEDENEPVAPPVEPERLKGVSISPRSGSVGDFLAFYAEADSAGDLKTWAGDWVELGIPNGPPAQTVLNGPTYHYTPVLIAQFFTQGTGELLRPLHDSTKQVYKNYAASFAQTYQPPYMAFGIEINMLYEHSPADFNDYVAFFPDVYDTVKLHSPETVVFTIFQLEKMKGLNGGLFGGINDTTNTTWFLLDQFPDADYIGITTYPCLVFQDPSIIPADYYTSVSNHTSKPIAITEMGWHTQASPAGWESSEAEQAAFVARFFDISDVSTLEFVIWSFLYDPDTNESVFGTIGLKDRTTGLAKQAWPVWVNGSW